TLQTLVYPCALYRSTATAPAQATETSFTNGVAFTVLHAQPFIVVHCPCTQHGGKCLQPTTPKRSVNGTYAVTTPLYTCLTHSTGMPHYVATLSRTAHQARCGTAPD